MSYSLRLNLFIPLNVGSSIRSKNSVFSISRAKRRQSSTIFCSRIDNSPTTANQQQLNLSVLRFTFGIPGLDESYLPRWIGYGFGSLLFLNHFLGSSSIATTPAQLRMEILGLSLAAFSVLLPYLGKFLKGANSVDQIIIPEGIEQIFVMPQNASDTLKEDMAWGTYVLLRNTSTLSVLISVHDVLCVRGYWNTPKDVSKDRVLDWFAEEIQRIGISNLKDSLYFPEITDSELWDMLPKGTCSVLVQPVFQTPNLIENKADKPEGFVLLASSVGYAYSEKDRAWIGAIANKFNGKNYQQKWLYFDAYMFMFPEILEQKQKPDQEKKLYLRSVPRNCSKYLGKEQKQMLFFAMFLLMF